MMAVMVMVTVTVLRRKKDEVLGIHPKGSRVR
jgi:hypothetical protein